MKFLLLLGVILILLLMAWICALRKKVKDLAELEKKQWSKAESNVMNKRLLAMWIEHGISRNDISNYFCEHKLFRIALYGMTEVGEMMYKVLEGTNIQVVGGIDRGRKHLSLPIEILRPNEFQEEVDAIVVVSFYYFSEIYSTLRKRFGDDVPILGLDEIIFELAEEKDEKRKLID